MIPLIIHIMIRNNEETITQALESLALLKAPVLVADAGCKDRTAAICRQYGAEVVKVSANQDRSHARNEMIKRSQADWQFYIEPWEILLSGHEKILELVEQNNRNNYHVEILQGDVITKQVRLWKKDSGKGFTNPVYENIVDEKSEYAEVMLFKEAEGEDLSEKIEAWKKNKPLAVEPYYFQACSCLTKRKYKEFMTLADYYLFQKKTPGISTIMTRYYLGVVHCYVTNDLESATRHAITCLGEHILMAEFWCLLGDIFFQGREFAKAILFYDNAKILGARRLRTDKWPMHISRYDEYPTEMIEKCNTVLSKSKDWVRFVEK